MRQIFLPFLIFMAVLGSCTGNVNMEKGVDKQDSSLKGYSNRKFLNKKNDENLKSTKKGVFSKIYNFSTKKLNQFVNPFKKKGVIKTLANNLPSLLPKLLLLQNLATGANGYEFATERSLYGEFINGLPDVHNIFDKTCNDLSLPDGGRGGTLLTDCGPYYYKEKQKDGKCCLYFNIKNKDYKSCSKSNCYTCVDNGLAALIFNENVINKEEPKCEKKMWGDYNKKGDYCPYEKKCTKTYEKYTCSKPCFETDFTNLVFQNLLNGKRLDQFCVGVKGYHFKGVFVGQAYRPIDRWDELNEERKSENLPGYLLLGNDNPNGEFNFEDISPINSIKSRGSETDDAPFTTTSFDESDRRRLQEINSTSSDDGNDNLDGYGNWKYDGRKQDYPRVIIGGNLIDANTKKRSVGLFVIKPFNKKDQFVCRDILFGGKEDETLESGQVVFPRTWTTANAPKPNSYPEWGDYPFAILTGQMQDEKTTYFTIYDILDKSKYKKSGCKLRCDPKLIEFEYADHIKKIYTRRVTSLGKGNLYLVSISWEDEWGNIGSTLVLFNPYCHKLAEASFENMPIINQLTSFNADINSPPILEDDREPLYLKGKVYGVGYYPETSSSEAEKGNKYAMQGGATLLFQIWKDEYGEYHIDKINVAKYVEPTKSGTPFKTKFNTIRLAFKQLGFFGPNLNDTVTLFAPVIGGQSEIGAGTVQLASPFTNKIFNDMAVLLQENPYDQTLDTKLILQEAAPEFLKRYYGVVDRPLSSIGFLTALLEATIGNDYEGYLPQSVFTIPLSNIIFSTNTNFLQTNEQCKEWSRLCQYVNVKVKPIKCEQDIKICPNKCTYTKCDGAIRETKLLDCPECKCRYGYDWQDTASNWIIPSTNPAIGDLPDHGSIEIEGTPPLDNGTISTSLLTTTTLEPTLQPTTTNAQPTVNTPQPTANAPQPTTTTTTTTLKTSTLRPTPQPTSTTPQATSTTSVSDITTSSSTSTTPAVTLRRRLGNKELNGIISKDNIYKKLSEITDESVNKGLDKLDKSFARRLLNDNGYEKLNALSKFLNWNENVDKVLSKLSPETRRRLSEYAYDVKCYNKCPRRMVNQATSDDHNDHLLLLLLLILLVIPIFLIAWGILRYCQSKRQEHNINLMEMQQLAQTERMA